MFNLWDKCTKLAIVNILKELKYVQIIKENTILWSL